MLPFSDDPPSTTKNQFSDVSFTRPVKWHARCNSLPSGKKATTSERWLTPWNHQEEIIMLRLALVFLLIAVVAGLLGFTGIELLSVELARILFIVFLVLFIVALIGNATYGRPRDVI
jgi:uncharacterized membrane protein YtjA (UPF0391 family)